MCVHLSHLNQSNAILLSEKWIFLYESRKILTRHSPHAEVNFLMIRIVISVKYAWMHID